MMTKGDQKSQKNDDVFYERPLSKYFITVYHTYHIYWMNKNENWIAWMFELRKNAMLEKMQLLVSERPVIITWLQTLTLNDYKYFVLVSCYANFTQKNVFGDQFPISIK